MEQVSPRQPKAQRSSTPGHKRPEESRGEGRPDWNPSPLLAGSHFAGSKLQVSLLTGSASPRGRERLVSPRTPWRARSVSPSASPYCAPQKPLSPTTKNLELLRSAIQAESHSLPRGNSVAPSPKTPTISETGCLAYKPRSRLSESSSGESASPDLGDGVASSAASTPTAHYPRASSSRLSGGGSKPQVPPASKRAPSPRPGGQQESAQRAQKALMQELQVLVATLEAPSPSLDALDWTPLRHKFAPAAPVC